MQRLVDPAKSASSWGAVSQLVERARSGDDEAFAALYRQHMGRVYALLLRLAGDQALAEELTQDVFVRAWERLGSYRFESAFSSWLHRLAVNVALTEIRSTKRRESRVHVTDPLGLEGEAEGRPVLVSTDIDLERAIAALPPGARTVFVLHEIEGYSHDEIGRLMGMASGTSKAQLFHARKQLREALER